MTLKNFSASMAFASLLAVGASQAHAQEFAEPLPVDSLGAIEVLPEDYPDDWIILQDANFPAIVDGRAVIFDAGDPVDPMKGMFNVAQMGSFIVPAEGNEIYVAETYYSRLTHGERTDVVTIWDRSTLNWIGEIDLPGGKRGQTVPTGQNFKLLNDGKWAGVFNFTPAASVTIVDLEGRAIVSDIGIPGCSMIYPLAGKGFMSLCGDGTMVSIRLGEQGAVVETVSSEPFNDIDDNPLFMTPAMIGDTAWFVSYLGDVRGIDLSGVQARNVDSFSLPRDASPDGEWRPGGWQVVSADDDGRLYVLMNPAGKEGSHKDGGSEVWVVDPVSHERIARLEMANWSFSVQLTHGDNPLLVATLPDGRVDVYRAHTGEYLHQLTEMAHSPYVMVAAP